MFNMVFERRESVQTTIVNDTDDSEEDCASTDSEKDK